MGRRATGFSLKPHRSGFWYVRFTIPHRVGTEGASKRYDLSTGTRDKEQAYREAEKIYADYLSGRRAPAPVASTARGGMSTLDAGAEWLASIAPEVDPLTLETYERYLMTLYLPAFPSVADITTPNAETFARGRLAKVQRTTVLKELSGLRGLARWAFGDDAPHIKSPPRKAVGEIVYDRKTTETDPKTVRRVLGAIKGRDHAREYFVTMYETSLRPATLYELRTPDHYKPGGAVLRITNAMDKARFGRELPLTPRARAALTAAARDVRDGGGLIFGKHDHREALERACAAVGAPRMTPYDFRHAFGTHAVERSGNLPGVAWLMGHRNTGTTSARYVHPSKRAAMAVLKGAR